MQDAEPSRGAPKTKEAAYASDVAAVGNAARYSEARIVQVPLPLDVYLEQTAFGKVFIDEVIQDGNADRVGLKVGDVVVAVSFPFGEGMMPVPDSNGLEMIAEFMSSRGDMERYFGVAVVNGAVDELRDDVNEKVFVTEEEGLRRLLAMNRLDYSFVASETEEEEEEEGIMGEQEKKDGYDIWE